MRRQDTIYIIGAGAIGKAFAVFLQNKGAEVIILRGSIDNNLNYLEEVEVALKEDKIIKAKVRVSTISNFSKLNGIVVLANKSYGNQQLAEKLENLVGASPVVILQNGLDVEVPFIRHGFPQIFRCVLFVTCQFITANKLRFIPVSVSLVGLIKGNADELAGVIQRLNNPYFKFIAEQNIHPVIWAKVIVNSVFNSICPLLETDNGIFFRDEKALGMAKRVIAECVAIASAQGIQLNFDKVLESLLLISKTSEGQLISTYQDINNKRRTEIENLNFAIVNIADSLNISEKIKETRILGDLISIKSALTRFN